MQSSELSSRNGAAGRRLDGPPLISVTACLCVATSFAFQVFLPLEEDKNDVKERFILYLEQLVQVPRGAV